MTEKKPINSRQKGARFERAIANWFKYKGFDAHRTAQLCGKTGGCADVEGVPGIHIECKHYKNGLTKVYDFVAQAVRDADANGNGDLPCVFMKTDNCSVLVTMRIEDWYTMFLEWYSGAQTEG